MKKKEKKYGIFKGILIFILIAVILSWLIPNGMFSESGFTGDGGLTRLGLNDIAWLVYYGVWFSIDKIILLLVIGGMYGVLTRISAYDNLVSSIAKKLKNKSITVVVFSAIIALLTSILTQSFVVIIFIPFIISILHKMGLDKMTILATTFGSMLVGVIGATYGTEGLVFFNNYMSSGGINVSTTVPLLIRVGILVIGLVLFNFFTLNHMRKVKKNALSTEMFEIEVEKEEKKRSALPIIILGILTFIIIILGFVNWEANFGITIFNKFHEVLTEISIGDFAVFTSILGKNVAAFGAWEDLFTIIAVLILFTVIIAICYKVKFEDFITNYGKGLKKMIKPIACVVGAFMLMTVVYMSPYLATIINKLLSLTDGFNLATMSLSAFISGIFHTDLGYSGYVFGSYLVSGYADYINPIYIIFISLYGFVQFFIPTSAILGIGLTSLDVKYKDWLKYIWRFLLGMLIVLLVIFILMTVV